MTVTIIDKTFDIIKKNRMKEFKQGSIPEYIWKDLIMHSNLGTAFLFDDAVFSVRYVHGKISIIDVEKYRQERKEALKRTSIRQLQDYEKVPEDAMKDEPTQDDSRGVRRFQSFWT